MREPLAPGSLLGDGQFQIGEVVGQGGFSLTYAATQGSWRLPVAIKEFFPSGCRRQGNSIFSDNDPAFQRGVESFLREGTTLERFYHPGVVRVLGNFRANGTAYLVEELLQGITLSAGLKQAGSMSLHRMLDLASQVGQAMLLVHAAGLIHSDLKPDNLFLTHHGRYVILDFGTARMQEGTWGSQGEVSPGYSPPEQYERVALTPAADVYALAASLYHLASGGPPPDARARLRGELLAPLETLSERLRQAIYQGLQLDPLQRTGSMRAFLTSLGLEVSPKSAPAGLPGFEALAHKRAHSGGVYALCLDSAGGRLYSAGRDGCWRSWSWPQMELQHSQQAHEAPIHSLALSADGTYLVSGAQDGSIRLWSALAPQGEGFPLLDKGPAVNSLAFHPAQPLVAACLLNGECCLLGPTLEKPNRWSAHQGSANSLAIDPAGNWLVTAGDDKAVHLWSLPEATYGGSLLGHSSRVQGVRFMREGGGLLTCCADMTVRAWELQEKREVRCLRGHKGMIWTAQAQHNLVLTACADRYLRAFRLDGGRLLLQSEAHEQWVRCLAYDSAGQLVASGGGDGKICQWRLPESASC
ncbi:MAG: serine/threonine protein kinase [Candidatus Eremiobacteraeota bacterium]|nr:serine/threonine protein kinase [Candidatus Eremiobacteraeota bacterium]MCW5870116.1 serine/threonine protein kinase [Candidatus Eremiobacteraeota bacterium]